MRLGLQRRRGAGAHLDEIAENLIVLDFQRLDAGLRRVGRLQLRQHHLGIGRELPQLVERGVVARRDETAIAREIGEAVAKRRAQPFRERGVMREIAPEVVLMARVEAPLTPVPSPARGEGNALSASTPGLPLPSRERAGVRGPSECAGPLNEASACAISFSSVGQRGGGCQHFA